MKQKSHDSSETDTPTKRANFGESLARESRAQTRVLTRNQIPYFLRPAILEGQVLTSRDLEGRSVMVMEPVVFQQGLARSWWEVCSRKDDWQQAPGATATVPPCIAYQASRSVKNCEQKTIHACTLEVMGEYRLSPQELLAWSARRAQERSRDASEALHLDEHGKRIPGDPEQS